MLSFIIGGFIGVIVGNIMMDYVFYKKSHATQPYLYYVKHFFKKIFNRKNQL